MKVEIYGTEWCTFCKSAVSLCETNSIDFNYIDVDDTSNLRVLEEKIGNKVRSVPQIFVDGLLLPGGYNQLKEEIRKIR